jgi:hypothetical protein
MTGTPTTGRENGRSTGLANRPVRKRAVAAIGIAVLTLCKTAAVEVKGVHFPEEVVVHGESLVLNGTAERSALGFGVYAVGLFLASPSTDANHIMTVDPSPKRLRIVTLRDLGETRFAGAVQVSIDKNFSADERVLYAEEIGRFLDCFRRGGALPKGTEALIDFVPGTGMVITLDGSRLAVIPGHAFYHAILRLWIGTPLQPSIKKGLLRGGS